MCQAKPALRCEYHAIANLQKAQAALARWDAERTVLKGLSEPLPEKLNRKINTAEAALLVKKQDLLELRFHQYAAAKSAVEEVRRGDRSPDAYTSKAKEIVLEVEKLMEESPAYASLIAEISKTRQAAADFLNHERMPDSNKQLIKMFELIDRERAERKKVDGKWFTTPLPLTSTEHELKDEALALLERGIDDYPSVSVEAEVSKDAPEALQRPLRPTVSSLPQLNQMKQPRFPLPIAKPRPLSGRGTPDEKPSERGDVSGVVPRPNAEDENRRKRLERIDRDRRAAEMKAAIESDLPRLDNTKVLPSKRRKSELFPYPFSRRGKKDEGH